MDDLTGLLLWGGSRLTCIVKTNSPCLSSHDEDVNTFQFQQATIFTATLLFQPQLITTMYIQLQMIIYKSSVCCFTHMHTDIISYTTVVRCKKSSDAPITTKDNTLLNLFFFFIYWTFSDKKCVLQTWAFLTMVSVQFARFIAFNHSCRRFFVWQWQQVTFMRSNF